MKETAPCFRHEKEKSSNWLNMDIHVNIWALQCQQMGYAPLELRTKYAESKQLSSKCETSCAVLFYKWTSEREL